MCYTNWFVKQSHSRGDQWKATRRGGWWHKTCDSEIHVRVGYISGHAWLNLVNQMMNNVHEESILHRNQCTEINGGKKPGETAQVSLRHRPAPTATVSDQAWPLTTAGNASTKITLVIRLIIIFHCFLAGIRSWETAQNMRTKLVRL